MLSQVSQQITEQMSEHPAGLGLCQQQNQGLSEGRVRPVSIRTTEESLDYGDKKKEKNL